MTSMLALRTTTVNLTHHTRYSRTPWPLLPHTPANTITTGHRHDIHARPACGVAGESQPETVLSNTVTVTLQHHHCYSNTIFFTLKHRYRYSPTPLPLLSNTISVTLQHHARPPCDVTRESQPQTVSVFVRVCVRATRKPQPQTVHAVCCLSAVCCLLSAVC
jgi:hypothetical protein